MIENQWVPLAEREQEHLVTMDDQMIYLRRKLIAAARAMRDGTEPAEPWLPHTYRYHSATEVIENGDYESAVARAIEKAKMSIFEVAQIQSAEVPG